MIAIHKITDTDEAIHELLSVAKKLREHGRCQIAYEICMQAVTKRIFKQQKNANRKGNNNE